MSGTSSDISTNSKFKILFFNFGGKASEWVKTCGTVGGNNLIADRLVTGRARGDAVKSLLDPGAFMEKVGKGGREIGVTPIVRVPAGRGDMEHLTSLVYWETDQCVRTGAIPCERGEGGHLTSL